MTRKLDLMGHVFERLTVLEEVIPSNKPTWRCRCVCGNVVTATTFTLRTGKKRSCGCLRREKSAAHCKDMQKHGHYAGDKPTPEWSCWASMRARCSVPTHVQYAQYGGRGITVCERWQDFRNFLEDMGPRPGKGYSIDRVDNSKGYSPENCRWATYQEQNNNTRFNHTITVDGVTRTLAEWCRELNLRRGMLRRALENNGSEDRALLDALERQLTGDRSRRK